MSRARETVGSCAGIHEFAVNRDVARGKITAPRLSDQEQSRVRNLCQMFLCQTQDIMVISASQSLVAGNHDKADFVFGHIFSLVKVDVFDFGRTMQNI